MKENKIPKRIVIALKESGLSQADLVKKTGINKGALSSYISGRYIPKQTNIYKMANALNVSPAWLMGMDVPMRNSDDFSFGTELEKIFMDVSKELNVPVNDLKVFFLNNREENKKESIELNSNNLRNFLINYFKSQKYKSILEEKGLMDSNGNINEDNFNKLMELADMMKNFKNKE